MVAGKKMIVDKGNKVIMAAVISGPAVILYKIYYIVLEGVFNSDGF